MKYGLENARTVRENAGSSGELGCIRRRECKAVTGHKGEFGLWVSWMSLPLAKGSVLDERRVIVAACRLSRMCRRARKHFGDVLGPRFPM